jgi:hypothetical protein
MANTPDGAYSPSDDELDELVENELEAIGQGGTSTDITDDSAHADPDPDEGNSEEDDEPVTQSEGDEDEIDAGSQPVAAAAAPPAAAIPTTGAKPFQFKASGAVHELPGALELPTGDVLIPKTSIDGFRRTLAERQELSTNFKKITAEHTRALNREKAIRTDRDIESDRIVKEWTAIEAMTPDERLDYFEAMDAKKPQLLLDIEREKIARDRKALEEMKNPPKTPEEVAEKRSADLLGELRATYQEVMQYPEIKGLPPQAIERIFKKHEARLERLVVKGEDGKELFDDGDVRADLEALYELHQATASATPASKAPTPAERNARRNADVNALPPVVRQRTPKDDPARDRKTGQFKGNRRGFRDAFMAGDLDG